MTTARTANTVLGQIVICLSLVAAGPLAVAQAPDGPAEVANGGTWFIRGDIDQDRLVRFGDVFPILGRLFGTAPAPGCLDSADANDDGRLNLSDPVWILSYLFLGGPRPPAPFPHCGPDPTGDALGCDAYDACPPGFELVNSIGMGFAYIPPGTFVMGSPGTDPERLLDEVQHLVTLTCGFYIGRTEVTEAQYNAVMRPLGGSEDDLSLPVNRVTWANAVEFCRRLSGLEEGGVHYRLPTESEWEYACRAGTTTRYWFGDAFECVDSDGVGDLRLRNCSPPCESVAAFEWWCGSPGALRQPVALKRPNPWGLYDMGGNVFEWCSDWYGEYPRGHVIDPTGPARGQRKVARSGGGIGYAYGRSAQRFKGEDNGTTGFRVVLDLPDCIRPSVPPQ